MIGAVPLVAGIYDFAYADRCGDFRALLIDPATSYAPGTCEQPEQLSHR